MLGSRTSTASAKRLSLPRNRSSYSPSYPGFVDVALSVSCPLSLQADPSITQAPVHQGPSALATYFTRLRSVPSLIALTAQSTSANSPLGLLKSCRYLLQDSPRGFFLSDQFIAGLKWLGQQGIGFDFTVDTVQQEGVLEDVIDAIARVREGQSHDDESKQTKFIIGEFAFSSVLPATVRPTVRPTDRDQRLTPHLELPPSQTTSPNLP